MFQTTQINLINLREEELAFWSSGNNPTQLLYGLTFQEALLHLKVLYLLCDKVLAASSFYFESDITRGVTKNLKLLFDRGEILYFVDETIESYTEHGLKKIEKSPPELNAYNDACMVKQKAKELDSLRYILRRPAFSISDKIVDLWIKDINSNEIGSIGNYLTRCIDEGKRDKIKFALIDFARLRTTDFVWEYIKPKLNEIDCPSTLLNIARRRLSQMYSLATSNLLGAAVDNTDYTLLTRKSKYDTSLFISCMDVLGIKNCLYKITPMALVNLKQSIDFIVFREFYFSLIESTSYNKGESCRWLEIFKNIELNYQKDTSDNNDFINNFRFFCKSMGKIPDKFTKPLDIILSTYNIFNNLCIKHFKEKLEVLSSKNIILYNTQHKELTVISIFISHSSYDVDLAKSLVNLIIKSIKIQNDEIRCTSVPGYKFTGGTHTSIQVKQELGDSDIVIGILTVKSLESSYVLFELGAGWFQGKAIALLGDGIDYNNIPGPLREHHALKLNNRDDLFSFIDDIAQKTNKGQQSATVINRAIDDFLS